MFFRGAAKIFNVLNINTKLTISCNFFTFLKILGYKITKFRGMRYKYT